MNREFSKSFRLHTSLMARILLGEYRDGDFLPSAGELADEFSVSIATVKRVFDVLAASNLIRRRNGRSPVVRLKSDYRNSVCKQLRVVVVFDRFDNGLYFGYRYAPWTWSLQQQIYKRLMKDHIPVVTIGKNDIDSMRQLLFSAAGVIYATARADMDLIEKFREMKLTYTVVTGFCEHCTENMVCYNYQPASERMAVYLLSRGVKKIDVIGNPRLDGRLDNLLVLLDKYGFKQGINLDSFEVSELYNCPQLEVRYSEPTPEEHLPLGIVCYNDYHASVVNRVLEKHKYRSKQDFVIISLGDLLEPADGGYCTLEIPELAEKSVDMLYRRMVNSQDEACCYVEPVFVVDRKKTKKQREQ